MANDSKSYLNWDGVQALWEKIKGDFAKKATELSGYGITDAYTKDEVDNKISTEISGLGTVFVFKGTKDTYADLPAAADSKGGDVWHVTKKDNKDVNAEYVFVQTSASDVTPVTGNWEELGSQHTSVTVTPVVFTKGTKVATIDVDGTATDINVPTVTVEATKTAGSKLATITVGDNNAVDIYADAGSDEKVKQEVITTGELPILVANATTAGTAGVKFATSVKMDAAAGKITATAFAGNLTGNVIGNLTGNADTATKATQDDTGAVIKDTYATKTAVDASIGEINDKMIEAIDSSELTTWLDANADN